MKLLEITGKSGKKDDFSLRTTGDLKKAIKSDHNESVNGRTATGKIAGGTDSFKFSGSLESLDLPKWATAKVNGEKVDTSNGGGLSTKMIAGLVALALLAWGAKDGI